MPPPVGLHRAPMVGSVVHPTARARPEPVLWDRPGEATDQDLATGIAHRRTEAYGELYRRYSRSVRHASRMILGQGPECEDVVTETFVAFWLRPDTFDPTRSSLLGYLRMKARGRSIDVLRARASRRRREEWIVAGSGVPIPPVESLVLEAESATEVRGAVAQLPPLEREVIGLAFFGDMTYGAVAQYLDLPEGTVKSRIRAGLRHLARNDGFRRQQSPEVCVRTAGIGRSTGRLGVT